MSGIERIAEERKRQIEREGYDTSRDDSHRNYELSSAACCYAQMGAGGPYSHMRSGNPPPGWPWYPDEWKPKRDPIKNLVRAGALIAAEIDRLEREAERRRAGEERKIVSQVDWDKFANLLKGVDMCFCTVCNHQPEYGHCYSCKCGNHKPEPIIPEVGKLKQSLDHWRQLAIDFSQRWRDRGQKP